MARTAASIILASSPTRIRQAPDRTPSRMMVAASAALTGALSRKSAFARTSIWRRSSDDAPSATRPAPISAACATRGITSSTWASLICSGAGRPRARKLFATMSVPTCPGITTATRTSGALARRSSMSASVKPFTANLAVL